MTKILFDSMSIHFSVAVFIEQLILHITYPLLLPYIVWKNGWIALYSQNFFPFNNMGTIFGLLSITLFYLMLISVYATATGDVRLSHALLPAFLLLSHRIMVAFKYATLSPSEYRRILRGHNISDKRVNLSKWPTQEQIDDVRSYQQQLQLGSGWRRLTPEIINYEVLVSAARCGIAIESSHFIVPNPEDGEKERIQFARWRTFLSKALHIRVNKTLYDKHLVRRPDGSYMVSLHCLCVAALHATCLCGFGSVVDVGIISVSVFNAVLPNILYCIHVERMHGWVVVYTVSSFFLSFTFFMIMLNFLYSAACDVLRRFLLSEVLEQMIRLVDLNMKARLRVGVGDLDPANRQDMNIVHRVVGRNTDAVRVSFARSDYEDVSSSGGDLERPLVDGSEEEDKISKLELSPNDYPDMSPDSSSLSSNGRSYSSSISPEGMTMDSFNIPQIDMRHTTNYIVWMQARTILHNFGYRVRFRLDMYNGGIIFLLVVLLLSLVTSVIRNNPNELFVNAEFLQTLLWIVVFSICLAAIIFIAHMTNKKMQSHRHIISSHMVNMQQNLQLLTGTFADMNNTDGTAVKWPSCPSAASERDPASHCLKESIKAAFTVITAAEAMDRAEPVKVLGIKCEAKQAVWIMYSLLLFLFVLFQYGYSGKIVYT